MKHSLLFYIFLLPVLILLYLMAPLEMSRPYMAWVLLLVAVCLCVFYVRREKVPALRGNLLKHSSFAILGFVIVHFQYYADYVLGNALEDNLQIWVSQGVVIKSMLLSTIGLICFLIGYLLRAERSFDVRNGVLMPELSNFYFLKLLAFISLCAYFLTANPQYMAGGYGAYDIGGAAKYSSLAFNGAVFAILIQVCRNAVAAPDQVKTLFDFIRLCGLSTIAMTAVFLASVALSGDRGPLMTYSMGFLFSHVFVTKRKFNWMAVILGVIVVSSAVSLLGVARSFGDGFGFSEKLKMAYQERLHQNVESVLPVTQELAGSVNVLHHVVDYMPKYHDHLYGLFQLEQLIYSVPFSGKFVGALFDDGSGRYMDVTNFITWIVQGDNPLYGSGATVVADFYIAFGALGVAAGMFIFGWLMRVLEWKMYLEKMPSIFWISFSLVYFCNALYISRSSLLEGFKLVIIVMVFVYLNQFVLGRRSARTRQLNAEESST